MSEAEEHEDLIAPADLGDVGRAYWLSVMEEFDLGPTEEPALGEVARTLDTLADLDAAIVTHGRVTPDGKPSPILVEQRQQRAILVRLLGLLDLPEEEEVYEQRRASASRAGRAAARRRWGSGTGRR